MGKTKAMDTKKKITDKIRSGNHSLNPGKLFFWYGLLHKTKGIYYFLLDRSGAG